ncbi:MAG: PAS domain S-box protein [Anaerolineae bacterium]|nr:PAS domain S-box protein [Anaerolineae bacterium]
MQQVSDAIIATDASLNITAWNQAASNVYGWSEAEALGQPIDVLLGTEFLSSSQADAQAELRATGTWQGEVRQRTRTGEQRYILAGVRLITSADGRPMGGVTVNHNITIRKRQAILQTRLSEVLEAIVEARPLPTILEQLARAVEEHLPDMRASVLLLNAATAQLHHGPPRASQTPTSRPLTGLKLGRGRGPAAPPPTKNAWSLCRTSAATPCGMRSGTWPCRMACAPAGPSPSWGQMGWC